MPTTPVTALRVAPVRTSGVDCPRRRRWPDIETGIESGAVTEVPTVAALVLRARQGDASAWDALVERFLPLVAAVTARHRLRAADADDVNQTVWLRLVEHLDDLSEPAALPGWIATTTRRECLRVLDRSRRALPTDPVDSPVLERSDDAFASPETVPVDAGLLRHERLHAVREALDALPEDRRELLLLLLRDPPVPYREISALLRIPVGSIGPTRARALDQLRRVPAVRALLDGGPDDTDETGETSPPPDARRPR